MESTFNYKAWAGNRLDPSIFNLLNVTRLPI